MDDIPTLTDMLQTSDSTLPSPKVEEVKQPQTSAQENQPSHHTTAFLKFFWNVEALRQQLYDKFDYRIFRRIENYSDGSACIKLTCPPYGKGEPGSQSSQKTLAAVSGANAEQLQEILVEIEDALTFFIRRDEMTTIAQDVILHLTPEQREALLRWTLLTK